MTLGANGRSALRNALKNSPAWPAHRDALGLDLSTMSVQALKDAAAAVGLDVFAVMNGVEAPAGAEVPAGVQAIRAERAAAAAAPRAAVVKADADDMGEDDGDDAARLAAAVAAIAGRSLNPAQIKALVQREVKAALEGVPATRIEVVSAGEVVGKVDGHKHPEFAKMLRAACARDASGYAPNVWIAGPAGSGKTHGVSMVAKALGAEFHYNGAIGMAHELLGFIDGRGVYQSTPFRKAYEGGGCYLFDEVDGSDNAALLALNAALANGRASFPDAAIERHAECRIFAAANTWGGGGTADYVGRARIDAAFLSRFPVRISWGYDNALEQAIAGDADFARRVQGARARAAQAGLKVLITPRDSIAGSALIAAGFSADEAAGMTYLASLSAEQARMIEGR